MKKLICLCLVGIIALSFAACGTNNIESESDTNAISSTEQSSQETTSYATEESSSTTSTTTESTTSTTSVAEVKPLNERIICGECCYYGLLGNVEEVETAVLYQQYDKLKCCKCGLVDGEDYKAGDYIYVLPE